MQFECVLMHPKYNPTQNLGNPIGEAHMKRGSTNTEVIIEVLNVDVRPYI